MDPEIFMNARSLGLLPIVSALSLLAATASANEGRLSTPAGTPEGWRVAAPRAEICPEFLYNSHGGATGHGGFAIQSDSREGLLGYWSTSFPVVGGKQYRFTAFHKIENVASPRRSVLARVIWSDERGRSVTTDEQTVNNVLPGFERTAEPEYPGEVSTDGRGWTEVSGIYHAPSKATRAIVELY